MDFIFHGNCFDGALCVALFTAAYKINYSKNKNNALNSFSEKIFKFQKEASKVTKFDNFDF